MLLFTFTLNYDVDHDGDCDMYNEYDENDICAMFFVFLHKRLSAKRSIYVCLYS